VSTAVTKYLCLQTNNQHHLCFSAFVLHNLDTRRGHTSLFGDASRVARCSARSKHKQNYKTNNANNRTTKPTCCCSMARPTSLQRRRATNLIVFPFCSEKHIIIYLFFTLFVSWSRVFFSLIFGDCFAVRQVAHSADRKTIVGNFAKRSLQFFAQKRIVHRGKQRRQSRKDKRMSARIALCVSYENKQKQTHNEQLLERHCKSCATAAIYCCP
jgi:hypothetical protein